MTESEAQTKWCPFTRVEAGSGSFSVNRSAYDKASLTCIASACMAWRWTIANNAHPMMEPLYTPSTTDGRCGLAQ